MEKDYFLIRRMKQGDESAVEDFVKLYYGQVLQYCYYKLSDKWLAEDITQDTFANFFKNFTTYVHQGKAKNYLYVIAGNLCKNQYKKQKEVTDNQIESYEISSINVQKTVLEKIVLRQEIDKLQEEFKEVVVLYYYQELKIREISKILGITTSLVKYRLSESKKVLKNNMNREDFYG